MGSKFILVLTMTWVYRLMDKHRKDVELTLKCSSKTAKEGMESQIGCRYSSLLQLPYFDAVRMFIIDPMHKSYLGTAKNIFRFWRSKSYLGTAKNIFRFWRSSGIIDEYAVRVVNSRQSQLLVPSSVRFLLYLHQLNLPTLQQNNLLLI